MKKILFTISAIYGGGAERALSNIINHFPKDWEVDILLNHTTSEDFDISANILTLSLPEFGAKKGILYFLNETMKRTVELRKLKKKNHYDACISFLDSSNISNVLSGNRKCKTIVSIRLDMMAEESGMKYKICAFPLIKGLYSQADRIVCVSKEIESNLVNKLHMNKNKVTTIENGYDCQRIHDEMLQVPPQELSLKGRTVIVTVGRLEEQKGQWHLIRAFSKVAEKEQNALLLIIGTGQLESYYKSLIAMFHMENNVILLGFCSNPFYYIAQAEIFILPSMYEGYPNALAEAVCCNKTCVATDFHSGAREILAPDMKIDGNRIDTEEKAEYGILIPLCSGKMYQAKEPLEKNETIMAETLIELIEDSELRKHYENQSMFRSRQFDTNEKVKLWINCINH